MNSIDAIATIFDEARARAPSVPTRSIEEVAADIDSLVAPRARPQEADDVYASATRGLRGASLSLENEQLFELWLAKADRAWASGELRELWTALDDAVNLELRRRPQWHLC